MVEYKVRHLIVFPHSFCVYKELKYVEHPLGNFLYHRFELNTDHTGTSSKKDVKLAES